MAPIPPRTSRLELICLAVLAAVFLIRFAVKFLLQAPFLMDFNVFHFTAQLVAGGQGPHLYDLGYKDGMFFRYAPVWAILWAPLAAFSLHHAGVVWSALSAGWLILTLWLSGRIVGRLGLPSRWWIPALAVLLLTRQLISEFSMGQADLWTGGLIALFVWHALQEREWLASFWLALAAILKLPALIFLPYLCITHRGLAWKTLVWMALLVPAGAVALDPGHPGRLLAAWCSSLSQTSSGQAFMIGDQSLMALLGRVLTADGYGLNVLSLPQSTVRLMALLADAALFGCVVWPGAGHAAKRPARFAADIAMLTALMVLASPAAWLATYTVLVFPLYLAAAWLAESWRQRRLDRWAVLLAALTGVCCVLTNSKVWKAFGIYEWRTESYVYLVFMIPPLVAVSLLGLLARIRTAARWQRRA